MIPRSIDMLCEGLGEKPELRLLHSARTMTDCSPLSLLSVQSVRQLSEETGMAIDKRCFRTNIYFDLTSGEGFAEDGFVGRSLRIGGSVTVVDPATRFTLHDDHARSRHGGKKTRSAQAVAQAHEGMIGVYGATLVEGIVRKGDPVELLD